MSEIPLFGWKDDEPPDITADHLEQDRNEIGKYAHEQAVIAENNSIPIAQKNAAKGVAGLNSNNELESSQIPLSVASRSELEALATNPWMPAGGIAETFSRESAGNAESPLTSGVLRLAGGVVLPAGVAVSAITLVSGLIGLEEAIHQWFVLVQASNFARLMVTADDTNAAWEAGKAKTLPLSVPFTPSEDLAVYIGVLIDAVTTPTVVASNSPDSVARITPAFGGNSTSGGLTNPASCPSTVSSALTAPNAPFYAYVT